MGLIDGIFENVGDAAGGVFSLLGGASEDQFEMIRNSYVLTNDGNDPAALIDGGATAPGSYSIFNPFTIFRYSKLGLNTNTYSRDEQLDTKTPNLGNTILSGIQSFASNIGGTAGDTLGKLAGGVKEFTEHKQLVENPTASNIISWAIKEASDGTGTNGSAVPYTSADFIWCKYYGKIPNNRMVTLRRYPIPIEDDIRIIETKQPLVPTAQAVTWYGADINNPLKQILNLDWGFNWKNIDADINDVTGNEITIDDLAAAANITDPTLINILKTQVFASGDVVDLMKISGYDNEIQKYIRGAYGANGPYWNRILGPVNVISGTEIRAKGFKKQNDITINFDYSIRSYGGINPKIAFLDLLTNFLSLTHNTAPFWGGGVRYFEQLGVTAGSFGIENEMFKGNVAGGIQKGLEDIATTANKNLASMIDFANRVKDGNYKRDGADSDDYSLNAEGVEERGKFLGAHKANAVEKLVSSKMGNLMKKPLMMRAILDGRAVGEHHITIGNPMNPMAMIGNLCLDSVKLDVGEVLGIDDFPTEFKFTVKLKHGRIRAKQDIESIFNLGNGQMGFSQLATPSSAKQSYGENQGTSINNAYGDGSGNIATKSGGLDLGDATVENGISHITGLPRTGAEQANVVNFYKSRVRNMYGHAFADSPSMEDYFQELKTKD
jgi:hypothetical protein